MIYCKSTLGRHSTKSCPDLLFYLAHIDFPKISSRNEVMVPGVAVPISFQEMPMILEWNICSIFVKPPFHMSCISPFSLITPPLTVHDRLRILAFRYLKRTTGIGRRIRLAAEVLDHSFTSAVTDRGHVERTTLFLTEVESNLSERRVWPILLLVKFLIPWYDDSAVQVRGWSRVRNKVCFKYPAS